MWKELSEKERFEYKKMILAFASLTEMFAQKAESEAADDSSAVAMLSPIINSKYQETVFQKVFKASAEDIGNTSYDAAIEHTDSAGRHTRYLIGIKTFGYASGSQKVAQFKANHNEWSEIINQIRENAIAADGSLKTKSEIDAINHDLYLSLAENIAYLRNKRIASSEANIQGFDVSIEADSVQTVYHVLMPSKKGEKPYIYVGETSYDKIDINNIRVSGCTSPSSPTNFNFTDGNHTYRFTSADSQLLMDFNNRQIVKEKWEVKYADDAYGIFSEIADKIYSAKQAIASETYSWLLTNKSGEVERYSGFNGFFGVGAKNKRSSSDIRVLVKKLYDKYSDIIKPHTLDTILEYLKKYLNMSTNTDESRVEKEKLRDVIISYVKTAVNKDFEKDIYGLIFRPVNEMYIPLPNSRKFHQEHPDFFGPGIGELRKEGSKWKLVKPQPERCFTMVFEPSGDEMEMFIGQDAGKGIESNGKQSILGEWLMEKVFMLDKYEPLTAKRLKEIGINGIRLEKKTDDERIHLHFVWIDPERLPEDYIK